MWIRRAISVLALTSLPLPAVAQTVAEAFECKLPYKPTTQAAAKLKVVSEGKPIDLIIGKSVTVTLEPGASRVFGLTPTRLTLNMWEPRDGGADKEYTMTFHAAFARSAAADKALLAAVSWKAPCYGEAPICFREVNPAGTGRLTIRRDKTELVLGCEFKLREKDLQQ